MPKPRIRHLSFRSDHHKADERGFIERSGKKNANMLTIIKNIYGKQYNLLLFHPKLSLIHWCYSTVFISLVSIGE